MFKKKIAAGAPSIERLKSRSLMCQEKQIVAAAQAPPQTSPELAKAIANRQARDAGWFRAVEEKTSSLIAQERTVRNLRYVYSAGTTFAHYATIKGRAFRTVGRIKQESPGMFLSSLGDGPDGWNEQDYACKFLQRQLPADEPKCEHRKSWCEECEFCDLGIDLSEIPQWDTKQANAILAKLGLSVWAGKSKFEGYCGEGRIVEGVEAHGHSPRPYRKGTKPDSFEKRGEQDDEAPPGGAQYNSRPDPNYAGEKFGLGKAANEALESHENLNAQQADVKQGMCSPEQEYARGVEARDASEDRILEEELYEKITEVSSDTEIECLVERARRKVEALDGSQKPGTDTLPEERSGQPEEEIPSDESDPPTSEAA